jgi:tRNA G18 (ribose-2'-O)-methylase SpoU
MDYRTLAKCDAIVEIPMYGSKNSLNVVVALGIVGYTINNAKLKMQN